MTLYGTWEVSAESEEDIKACRWIRRQLRKMAAGEVLPEEVRQLKKIGIEPEPEESPWMEHYNAGKRYRNVHGNLNVPANYVTDDGIRLGAWVVKQRGLRRSNELPQEQIELLDQIGMLWDPRRTGFDRGVRSLERYITANGHANIPAGYIDDEGYPLYQWVTDVRKRRERFSSQEIDTLTQIGFEWRTIAQIRVDEVRTEVHKYLDAGGSLDVSSRYQTAEGFPIGRWLATLKKEYCTGKHRYLTPELAEHLALDEVCADFGLRNPND